MDGKYLLFIVFDICLYFQSVIILEYKCNNRVNKIKLIWITFH